MSVKKFEASGSDKWLLVFEGEKTILQADELRKILIKALIDANHVEMDFEKATAVDLSCLQLLCSAHRSAVRLNKRLMFAGGRPEVLKQAMEAAGYSRVIGCQLDCEKSCLWVGN